MTIDWNKFTNFRSRNTRKDLERLLNGAAKSKSRTKDLLERADQTGLYPIHWAAINNRPDMIEVLFEAGSPLAKPCRNRLFADGTPLHLAAMNGCLEAAAMLLAKSHELQSHKTRPKSLASSESDQTDENNNNNNEDLKESEEETNKLLEARDAEGQTPLMRAAAPRSKRMDAIRDLLRKNFWSLSGRPAEMALFLICMGAEWRHTEPAMGMNLLHLAVVNDYDDIVSLLLALDRSLIDVPTASATRKRSSGEAVTTDNESDDSNATSPATSPNDGDDDETGGKRPLINERSERVDELLAAGLKPLQLAILYGRVSSINQLWHASQEQQKRSSATGTNDTKTSHVELRMEAFKNHRQSPGQRELKRILMRACYTNKQELAKLLKPGLLKGALTLDLAILALVWAPTYVIYNGFAGGIFIFSYVISMALGLRVVLKNPGYLRRNSVQYLSELARLMDSRRRAKQPPPLAEQNESPPMSQQQQNESQSRTQDKQEVIHRRKSTAPLIKLEPPPGVNNDQKTPKREDEEKQISTKSDQKKPLVVSVASAQMSVNAFRDLQDKVRLFCHKCQCIRRPRSRHCNSCNHCVQDFDHHCIYLGCCIGRYNRLDFLLALIALAITAIYGTILHSVAIGNDRGHLLHALGVVWVGKYVLIGGLSAFLNARRACLGITQYEEVRSKRIRRTFGRLGPPEEISNSHHQFSTHRNAFWRYAPDRFLTGELTTGQMLANLREYTNYLAPGEYLLTFICTDTPLARSLTSSDWRMKQLYKFV